MKKCFIVLLLTASVIASDTSEVPKVPEVPDRVKPSRETVKETNKKLDNIPPKPDVVTRPILSEAVHWTLDNADTAFGKSLAGWSTTKLDSDFKPLHVKIGVISGRAGMLNEITREEYRRFGILEEWHRTRRGTVLGFQLIKEF